MTDVLTARQRVQVESVAAAASDPSKRRYLSTWDALAIVRVNADDFLKVATELSLCFPSPLPEHKQRVSSAARTLAASVLKYAWEVCADETVIDPHGKLTPP
jgi:hypothetical protein